MNEPDVHAGRQVESRTVTSPAGRARAGCLAAFVVLVVLVAGAWWTGGAVLSRAGELLIEEGALRPVDVVVVLTGEHVLGAAAAADVVRAGHAPRVLLLATREPAQEILERLRITVPAGAELARLVLERRGVASARIVVLPLHASGTNETVREVARYLAARGWTRVAAVTYRSHTRRAAALLRRALGPGSVVIARAPAEDPFRADRWWRNRDGAREFAMESLRWLNSLVLGDLWR